MGFMDIITKLIPVIVIILILLILASNIRVVQQSRAYVIERLGAFQTVWGVGLHFKIPFIERVVKNVSLKEQVVDFPPQPVITKDNVTMQIDTVIYFQITDPKLYTYGVEQPMSAIENLTATTLRNIIGDLELDQSLTSRDHINAQMRAILDEATDNWGIKVNRVELKNIMPPRDIQESMEKQMRAERERRESILQAEGQKQSQILVAEGEKQSAILKADAAKQAAILQAEGAKQAKILEAEAEAEAILKVQQATADAIRLINEAAPRRGRTEDQGPGRPSPPPPTARPPRSSFPARSRVWPVWPQAPRPSSIPRTRKRKSFDPIPGRCSPGLFMPKIGKLAIIAPKKNKEKLIYFLLEKTKGGSGVGRGKGPGVGLGLLVMCFVLALNPVGEPVQSAGGEAAVEVPVVALTFDDGPRADTTGWLLEQLELREVPATFFMVGSRIPGNEDLVRQMKEQGCQIGVHTYDHVDVTGLSQTDFDLQIGKTRTLLREILGGGKLLAAAALRLCGPGGTDLVGRADYFVVGGPGGLEGPRCGAHRGQRGGAGGGRRRDFDA